MRKNGRPTIFTQKIGSEICARLATGESLRSICKDRHMPHRATVHEWVVADREGFADQYTRAKLIGIDERVDLMMEIAETPQIGERVEIDGDNKKVIQEDMLGHRRLIVDTIKWQASKLYPKIYGDRSTTQLTGADEGPIQISDADRAAKISAILAAAERRRSGGNGESS